MSGLVTIVGLIVIAAAAYRYRAEIKAWLNAPHDGA